LESYDSIGRGVIIFIVRVVQISVVNFQDYLEMVIQVIKLPMCHPFSKSDRKSTLIVRDPTADILGIESLSPSRRQVVGHPANPVVVVDHPLEVFDLFFSVGSLAEYFATVVVVHE